MATTPKPAEREMIHTVFFMIYSEGIRIEPEYDEALKFEFPDCVIERPHSVKGYKLTLATPDTEADTDEMYKRACKVAKEVSEKLRSQPRH